MSLENRGGCGAPTNAPVYTIYPGGEQGSTNYGFHGGHPQAPPPKYEDVISGEYLKWNYTGYEQTSSTTHDPTDSACHCACSHATSPRLPQPSQTELSSQDDPKEKRHNAVGAFLFGLLLIVIFIWRIFIS